MTGHTTCPHCQQQLAIPDFATDSAKVRCPLCEEEFTLADSFAHHLPELIVVDPGLESSAEPMDVSDDEVALDVETAEERFDFEPLKSEGAEESVEVSDNAASPDGDFPFGVADQQLDDSEIPLQADDVAREVDEETSFGEGEPTFPFDAAGADSPGDFGAADSWNNQTCG